MYVDHAPVPNPRAPKVIVIEESDKPYTPEFVERVISTAQMRDATSIEGDGDEVFWIVFAKEPKRLWDLTEKALRREFR